MSRPGRQLRPRPRDWSWYVLQPHEVVAVHLAEVLSDTPPKLVLGTPADDFLPELFSSLPLPKFVQVLTLALDELDCPVISDGTTPRPWPWKQRATVLAEKAREGLLTDDEAAQLIELVLPEYRALPSGGASIGISG